MPTAILVLIAAVGLWGLHRGLTYAEERGWVYYRKKRGSYGGLASPATSSTCTTRDAGTYRKWCEKWNGSAMRMMTEMPLRAMR
jgi:hypothetical protein